MDYAAKYSRRRFALDANGVLLITIDNPKQKNAMTHDMHSTMGSMWRDISNDPDVRVAVITGAGDAFCSGGDLGIAEEASRGGSVDVEDIMNSARDVVLDMAECRKPIVSAINGVAVGGGLATALAADLSIIGDSVSVFDGHMKLGIAAGDHSVLLWPLFMSMAKAKYYLLTCDSMTGAEAAELGLVSKSVPTDQVLKEALAIAGKLAAGPQSAIRLTKRALNQWLKASTPAFELSLAYEMINVLGDDFREGVKSVREKRPPQFPSAHHATDHPSPE
ncbi:enoyl-CoA hydratase/isomerase family protein [Streptomyces sp. NPDC101455]|uniref:enoyl-CoA hydratase/isomerase family protein n=1 Tax=Streptomyces sp. NPDC101455 TaxID=3366142 RepID=UPI00380E96D3